MEKFYIVRMKVKATEFVRKYCHCLEREAIGHYRLPVAVMFSGQFSSLFVCLFFFKKKTSRYFSTALTLYVVIVAVVSSQRPAVDEGQKALKALKICVY